MKIGDFKELWQRVGSAGEARRVARELGGPQAQEALMAAAGYGGNPAGLAARLGAEVAKGLPLKLDTATLRAYGASFPAKDAMDAARAEADCAWPLGEAEPQPAGGIRLSPEQRRALWPWVSGQAACRLARAFAVANDAELAQAAHRHLAEFCQHNPPLMGPGWTRPGTVAVRAVNWLWALAFLGRALPGNLMPGLLVQLTVAGQVLEQELNGEVRPGQEGPAAALMHLGRVLGFMPQAQGWLEAGAARLGPALGAWARPGPARATGRAVRACAWGALGLWLGIKARVELPGALAGLRPLAALCRALAPPWADGPGWGWLPGWGVLDLDQGRSSPATAAANLAATLMTEPGLRAGRELDEGLFWLQGSGAAETLRQLAGGGDLEAGELAGAGVAWLAGRAGGRRVSVWLCASPREEADGAGPGSERALAVALCLEGRSLLPTPGPPSSGPLGPHLASRQAQSAVLVDGAQPQGGVVELEGLEAGPGRGFAAAAWDGYAHLDDPVRLRRRLFLDSTSGVCTVVDQVEAQGEHLVEVLFHLPGAARVERRADGLLLEGLWGEVLLQPDVQARVEVVTGRAQPPLGWRSDRQGRIFPAPVVRVWARTQGNARLVNALALVADW